MGVRFWPKVVPEHQVCDHPLGINESTGGRYRNLLGGIDFGKTSSRPRSLILILVTSNFAEQFLRMAPDSVLPLFILNRQ